MSSALTNPLQSLINQASKSDAKGEVSRLRTGGQRTLDRVVILADTSHSMSERAGHKSKIDLLRDALTTVWSDVGVAHLIAFSSQPQIIAGPSMIPAPAGSTALHYAIQAAQPIRPERTVVISDGRPDNEEAALAAAQQLTGTIDVIYCGPEADTQAIAFLQRLARSKGGACHITIPQNLLMPVKRLLLLA